MRKGIKWFLISINILYSLVVLLFVLDLFKIAEIKGEKLVSFIHFGALSSTPVIVISNLTVFRISRITLFWCISPLILVLCFCTVVSKIGIMGYLFSIGSYQTQTIHYVNFHKGFRTIEFQMQDAGALGYNKRFVEVTYLTPWLMITKRIDQDKEPGANWVKIDKDLNELNLKY